MDSFEKEREKEKKGDKNVSRYACVFLSTCMHERVCVSRYVFVCHGGKKKKRQRI